MKFDLEYFLYTFLGNNIVIGSHIKDQLNFLSKILPDDFKRRKMYDLGCGDGKITSLLKEIFQPKECLGFDVNPRLIKLAQKRGIKAEVFDLERGIPKGELATIWGVLHHLKSPKKILKRLKENFKFIFIREPLKTKITFWELITFLELGKPFEKEKFQEDLRDVFRNFKSFVYKNAIFIFWRK